MSKLNATNFLTAVQKDKTKYERVATMSGPAVTQMAADMGYPCGLDDLKSVLKEAKQASQGLSDAELENVAGGQGGQGKPVLQLSQDCDTGYYYPKGWDGGGPRDGNS